MSGRLPRSRRSFANRWATLLVASLGGAGTVGCREVYPGLRADVAAFRRIEATTPTADVAIAADPFLAGLEPLARAAERILLGTLALPPGAIPPTTTPLDGVYEEFRAILPRVGLVDTGALYVFGAVTEVPGSPPSRCARVALDVEAEKAALSADEAVERRSATTSAGERRMARFAMLKMGEGPFTYDFRWTFVMTSHARPDGIVLVRYDFVPADDPQRVSAFSGVEILVPHAGGTLLAGVFAVGSPLSPPFFLKNKARRAVDDILSKRIVRLGKRMASGK
jgi:hypothetical protein